MLPSEKRYAWTVFRRSVFLDKEYSFEVSQTILAVPSFSKISVKKWLTFTVNSAEILQTILQNASNLIYNCILIDLFSDGERTFSGKHLTEIILIKWSVTLYSERFFGFFYYPFNSTNIFLNSLFKISLFETCLWRSSVSLSSH